MHLEEKLAYYLSLRAKYEDDFREIIQTGIANNEIVCKNPEVMLFSILSTLRSLYQWIPKKEEVNPEELAINLGEILINGIKK
jgi:5'-deoxynucleotidase YfbR-like HD superfamily hydrolase